MTARHPLQQQKIWMISLLLGNFFSSIWLQSICCFFQPPYLWNEIILICFIEDVRRLRIFLFLTYPNSKASQRFSLVQLGEGGMKGVSIRKGAKCYIWVRIFSQSASVDLSGNEKENERKTPQSPNPTA